MSKRLEEHIEFLKSIDDDVITPVVVPFEGVTTAGGAAPNAIPWSVPQDRSLFIYDIFAAIQPSDDETANEAAISHFVTADVLIDNEKHLFNWGNAPNGFMAFANIIGSRFYPKAGIELKFPYHIRPNVNIQVTFGVRIGFPAAARFLNLNFNCVQVKKPHSGGD